jgi:SAM-dependent methyltransferase
LIHRYEAVAFEHKFRAEIHLLPASPCLILDIGAGTGADAAWLASRGHKVVAVEPVEQFRTAGSALHPSPAIEWVEDGLPYLRVVANSARKFDVILATAVWMHLDERQREIAMVAVAELLAPSGLLLISLRHGPVPVGRRMFDVNAPETVALAAAGLSPLLNIRVASSLPENQAAGVEWTRLVFARAAGLDDAGGVA